MIATIVPVKIYWAVFTFVDPSPIALNNIVDSGGNSITDSDGNTIVGT